MPSNPNYDSEFCGKVPIHLINTIQPYGALLVLDKSSLRLVQVSDNVESLFGQPVASFIQTPLKDHLDEASYASLQHRASSASEDKISQVWTIHHTQYLCLLHIKSNYILVEIDMEPYSDGLQRSFVSIFQDIKYSMSLVEKATSTEDVCITAARELKRLSGFDKVMVYRFDKEWNGYVISEEMEPGMESYLGFTFPASDIPKQARELYLRNPYRFIPDRTYKPVQLYPVMNPLTHSFIDLSDCNVRGVVSVHLEYLANMGVTASMSTRILNNDQLWGLIACHHRTAKHLPFELCSMFELMSHVISSRILALQSKERHDAFGRAQASYTQLVEQIYETSDIRKGLFGKAHTVLDLFRAQGAAIRLKDKLTSIGATPTPAHMEELIFWLHTRKLTKSLHTDQLRHEFDRAENYVDLASGLLAIPIHPANDEFLLIFRPEVKKVIDWGGDPGGRIIFEKDEKNYHPRHSFKLWRQILDGTSLPWKEEELEVAESLRSFLYEYPS